MSLCVERLYYKLPIYLNDIITMALQMAIANVIQIKILRLDTVGFVQIICIQAKFNNFENCLAI